jgi:hypothetical protein
MIGQTLSANTTDANSHLSKVIGPDLIASFAWSTGLLRHFAIAFLLPGKMV